MSRYTLGYVGFSTQQEEAISAVLYFASSALDDEWEVVAATDSDVVFINLGIDAGRSLLAEQQEKRADGCLILVGEALDEDLEKNFFLEKKDHAPLSLKKLTALLNQVSVYLMNAAVDDSVSDIEHNNLPEPESAIDQPHMTKPSETVNVLDVSAVSESGKMPEANVSELAIEPISGENILDMGGEPKDELFAGKVAAVASESVSIDLSTLPARALSAKNYFFGLLQQALKDKACRIVKLLDLPVLYLMPDSNQYYFVGTEQQLSQFYIADPKQLKEKVVKKMQLEKALEKEHGVSPQALDNLLVQAVLCVSQGRLLKGHTAKQKIALVEWPDGGKIAGLAEYGNIAKFLKQQPNDLVTVAEVLRMPLSQVFDFYNVAYLLNYLRIFEEPNELVVQSAPKNTLANFLSAFFKR